MMIWNSWRQRPKQLSELHSTGIAYFVLDELGDKVAGPFANEGDARTFMLSLQDGEFQIAQEYWGLMGHRMGLRDRSRSAVPDWSVVGRICKAVALLCRTTSTSNGHTGEQRNSVYSHRNYATRMHSCWLWPSPSYYLDYENTVSVRLPTNDEQLSSRKKIENLLSMHARLSL